MNISDTQCSSRNVSSSGIYIFPKKVVSPPFIEKCLPSPLFFVLPPFLFFLNHNPPPTKKYIPPGVKKNVFIPAAVCCQYFVEQMSVLDINVFSRPREEGKKRALQPSIEECL